MPGASFKPQSLTDAWESAKSRGGIKAVDMPIKRMNAEALNALDPIFMDSTPNVAEENIQSRLRGTLVMAVANKLGAIALTTGNKSEMAVGYCTIYGDMNGGSVAPIADVYKTRCYDVARYLNTQKVASRWALSVSRSTNSAPGQKTKTAYRLIPCSTAF